MRTPNRVAAALAATALVAGGCSMGPFAEEGRSGSTAFGDVIDLVPRGSVRMNDITVGTIDSVELSQEPDDCPTDPETDELIVPCAIVNFTVDAGAPVPSNVGAALAKTSVLGERFVDLVVLGEPEGAFEDGATVRSLGVRTDLEDLVSAGSDLLSVISAQEVGVALETAAEAFGGRAGLISGFIDDVNGALSTFDDNTDTLLALIDSLDAVTAAYAPNAEANAAVLADLREAAAALQEQDDQLLDTLDDVTVLSQEATEFLGDHQGDIENTVRRVRKLLDEVVEADQTIRDLLLYAPRQLTFVPLAEVNEDVVVWLDFIVCGLNETEGNQAKDCTPTDPTVDYPYHPVPERCYDNPEPCQAEAREG